jgi:transposase
MCDDGEIAAFTKAIQQDLFRIGSSLATPTESPKPQVIIDPTLVDRLTAEVHRIEAIEGILADWSIPGEHTVAAAFDVARTICRRGERALVRLQEAGGVIHEVHRFGTTTRELLELADWLASHGCTHVAMESTGIYWKPVWHVLEGSVELLLANAMHIRNIPGRKSDVNEATWIADLLAHGLIRGSFVPPASVQELRDLTRTRKQLVREIAQHTQRLQKVLEDANLKLTAVVSDILGVSGRAILDALSAGETDAEHLADLSGGRLKAPRAVLRDALHGRITAHHRFLLRLHLGQIDALHEAVRAVEADR